METTVGKGSAPMSPEQKKREIPLLVAKLCTGAVIDSNYENHADLVGITWEGKTDSRHVVDYEFARQIADKIQISWLIPAVFSSRVPSVLLQIIEFAQSYLSRMTDFRAGKKGIVMLSDNDGCGFWRMRLPARHIKGEMWYADITSAAVRFENLLEYDTVFVQRFHEWDAYYVLEKLKKAGKRIVYDIDDDLFSIPRENPAANVIRKDQQFAALATMKLADVVTVSTEVLKNRLESDLELKGRIEVIPNAIELDGWNPTPLCGSPDGFKRIFWTGGTTHAEDWHVCINAVEHVMKQNSKVLLTILGFLPPVVMDMVRRNSWTQRVEYMPFSEPDTYYMLIRHIRAEVGICPLVNNKFNQAKSELKFVENTFIGMPTIASQVAPYESVIEHGKNGYLLTTENEWVEALSQLLDDRKIRQAFLVEARKLVTERFDIRKVAAQWESVLLA